jgi:MYXO-CTERM domain-containing protein
MSVIEIFEEPGGRWRWGYREGDGWKLLTSNEDYPDPAAAGDAAAAAYPGVPITRTAGSTANDSSDERKGGAARKVAGWLTPVVVLAAWARSRRR